MYANKQQYLATALWSSTDDEGEPLDSYQFSDAAERQMGADLQNFLARCEAEAPFALAWYGANFSAGQFAHDFWLTRNGHGAGFWDRDYSQPGKTHLDTLSAIARSEGACNLYLREETQEVEIA